MLKIPVIDVIGYKDSGKTSIVEKIIRRISEQGYRTCVFKHVHDPSFSIDTPGKDSWRVREAGAEKVVLVSEKERAVIERFELRGERLESLLALGDGFDLIILEGFKSIKPAQMDIHYLLAARNEADISQLSKGRKNILFINSLIAVRNKQNKRIRTGNLLTDQKTAEDFIDNTLVPLIKIGRIWRTLPDLDCGECGYKSCRDMARELVADKKQEIRCPVDSAPPKLIVQIEESRISMKRFVQEIIRGSVMAMVSTLKGTRISGDEDLTILIKNKTKIKKTEHSGN